MINFDSTFFRRVYKKYKIKLHDDLFINKSNFNMFPEIYNKILIKIKSKKDEYFISNRYNNIGTLYLALKFLEQSENIKKESHEKTLCNIGCL